MVETDFVKDLVAVEAQSGKYSFAKHLAFYVWRSDRFMDRSIGDEIMQAQMSSGPGYYEGALYDLALQDRVYLPYHS